MFHQKIKIKHPLLDSKTEVTREEGKDKNIDTGSTDILIHIGGATSVVNINIVKGDTTDTDTDTDTDMNVTNSTSTSSEDIGTLVGTGTEETGITNTKKKKKKPKKKIVKARWDARNNPEYYHFTLIKTRMTTDEAVDSLASRLDILPSRFGICGNKDKRACKYSCTSGKVVAW